MATNFLNSRAMHTGRLACVALATACATIAPSAVRPVSGDACNPPSRSAIAWQVVSSPSPTVRGRIVRVDSLTPIDGVALFVGTPPRAVRVADDGTFDVRLDSAGRVAIDVRRFGYMRAQTVVVLPPDSAVELVAALERRNLTLDGCGANITTVPPR